MARIERSFLEKWKWLISGFVVLILGISVLELKQPFYFVRDDSFAESFPVILEGCRVLMRGAFLDWSPYQFLGFPVAGTGGYALTYPPTYLSYAIARFLLGNEFLTLDVFCILHLIAGYFLTYALLRRVKLQSCLAAAGSLSFVLSGYTLIAGRSWFSMVACVPWLSLLFISVISLQQSKPGWKWIIGTGTVIGLFFHIGHAQIWMYAVLFFLFSIVILFCAGKLPFYNLLCVIPAFLFGLACIMPLLIPQWSFVAGLTRPPLDAGIPYKGLAAMLVPYPLVHALHPVPAWGTALDQRHMTPFYYSGTLFSAVFFVTIAAGTVLLLFKPNKWVLLRRFMADNVWFVCALLALVLAMGNRGLLWTIQSKLPLFDKFRMPFKFLLFVNLFTVMGSGILLERYLARGGNKKFLRPFLAAAVCGLMLYHANLATASFYSYNDRPVYSKLPKEMNDILSARAPWARVLSLVPERSPDPGYIFSLKHNFPMYFRVWAFAGYDPFIANSLYFTKANENLFSHPLEAARAYGVQWVIVKKQISGEDITDARTQNLAKFFFAQGARRLTYSDYVIVELADTHPLAFEEGNSRESFPVSIRDNGLDIDVSRIAVDGGSIVVNMLWRPGTMVLNGRQKLTCGPDLWGRVVVPVPPDARLLNFRFTPPWKTGCAAGLVCLFCAILGSIFVMRTRV